MDAICLVFDCVPSEISTLFWKYTRNDFRVKLRLHLGHAQAKIVQDYQIMGKIASEMFGEASSTSPPETQTTIPATAAEMQAAFKEAFGS